jgi:hypothetical protein
VPSIHVYINREGIKWESINKTTRILERNNFVHWTETA